MKVLVTGAYSTGKTSLCEMVKAVLADRGLCVHLIPDVARRRKLALNDQQTDRATLWLFSTQIAVEIEAAESEADVVLCDRGVADVLAHAHDVAQRSGWGSLVQAMRPFAEAWLHTYDLILVTKVDPLRPPVPDGVRNGDPTYRQTMANWAERVLDGLPSVSFIDPVSDPLIQALSAIDAAGRLPST